MTRSHSSLSDLEAMEIALDAARKAGAVGEVPVGAVLLVDGAAIAIAGNARESHHDPTAHAEVQVLRNAAMSQGSWRLDTATLVVTLEPCLMCAGAILNARVPRVVIGALDPKAGALGSLYNVGVDPRLNHHVNVTVGVLTEVSAELIKEFFAARR